MARHKNVLVTAIEGNADYTSMLAPEAQARLREMTSRVPKEYKCEFCQRVFMSGAGLSAHARYCKD